ncbi:MAG: TRAM domain-containing protein [candidate division WOR-3 bacterium]|nr:TRAM domain-containing protein [candidate division WOR-3 bacterium]MCX7756839.1 TRAM domain-containing protein [candidate division WOR-3 bacterium]MDW7987512.1 TRAM domain-containing protein [candidate division WOR-3 bacterium]
MWTKEPTYIVTKKSLVDPRLVKLFSKKVLWGKLTVVENSSTSLSSELAQKRAEKHLATLQNILGKKLKVLKQQLGIKDLQKLLVRKNRILLSVDKEEIRTITGLSDKITVLDINELYEDLRPEYLPGTELKVLVSKKGKEENEGIGYIEAGIKVVVTDGAEFLGKEIDVVVTAGIETNIGKMIFARPKYKEIV